MSSRQPPLCLKSISQAQITCQVARITKHVAEKWTLGTSPAGTLNRDERSAEARAVILYRAEGPGFPGPSPISALVAGQTSGVQGTESPGLAGVILDSVAKRSEEDYVNFQKACPGGFITGSCENGHRYAKEVYCGREWCPVCNGKWVKGSDMKPSHARRFARWYPKAQQIDSMGYWTFTIPEGLRSQFRTKEALTALGHQVQELLKSYGYSRGLRRWHWFGDRSRKWNPHLNCLVDGGLLNGKALRAIRRAYSALLGVKLAIAEYHYLTTPGQKVHALRYPTRATFLDAKWDVPMALELRGFRNQLWWGSKRWECEPVWSLDDIPGERAAGTSDIDTRAVAALELGYCPLDGLPIVWGRWQPVKLLPFMGGRSIGAGYWQLPEVSPPLYAYSVAMPAERVPPPGIYKRSLGGSFMPAELVDARKAEFSRQHRRFVAYKSCCHDLEDEVSISQLPRFYCQQRQNSSDAKQFRGGVPLGENPIKSERVSEHN